MMEVLRALGDFFTSPWGIVIIACTVGLVATSYALFAGGRAARPMPPAPEWLVPSPPEVRHERFPLSWQGYDPAHVDVFIDALSAAYEELYFAAGPTTVQRARARLAERLGIEGEAMPQPPGPPPAPTIFQPMPRAAPRDSGEELEDLGGDGPGVLDR